jgi:hypothetical protein
MMKNLILGVLIILLFGCEKSEFEVAQATEVEKMEWLLHASPSDDFESAINKKDFRFIGLYGNTSSVPNISKSCINIKTDVNFIKGSSETLYGYEHVKLNAIAHVYASDYNFRMLRYLEEKQLFKCAL